MKKYIKPNTEIVITGSEWNITDDWTLHSKQGVEEVTKDAGEWDIEDDTDDW